MLDFNAPYTFSQTIIFEHMFTHLDLIYCFIVCKRQE